MHHNQWPISPQSVCTQPAISGQSARNQFALSPQSVANQPAISGQSVRNQWGVVCEPMGLWTVGISTRGPMGLCGLWPVVRGPMGLWFVGS